MSGFRILAVATVALALFLAVIGVGYLPKQAPEVTSDDEHASDAIPVGPMQLEKWPKPAAALILTGEQHGFIEPCGCTADQSGGVSRRADLVRQLREKGWKTAGLDLGGLVKRSRSQSRLIFETLLQCLTDMGYQAIGLGPEEVKLQPDYLLSQHNVDDETAIGFVAANLTFYDTPDLGTPGRLRTFKIGGLTVAVTAVVGASKRVEFRQVRDVSWTDPAEALPPVIEQLKGSDADLLVLLSQGSLEEARKLAGEFPDFDVILSAGGPEDPDGKPEAIGKTWLINVGHKGKHTGVLAVYPDQPERFRFELVRLDRERFKDSDQMIAHMSFYQQRLRDEQIAAEAPPVPHPSGAVFKGSEACRECHEEEYDIWKDSGHAMAFASLDPSHKRHGFERLKGISRVHDAECLACHVTGWNPQDVYRYTGGFINEEFARTDTEREMSVLLQGSGCENCHGPGSRHIELMNEGDEEAGRLEVRVTKEQAEKKMCYRCHDLDNSPNFEFSEYWPKVAH